MTAADTRTPRPRVRLARRRRAAGLSQCDLARELGVDRSTVVRWERGETWPHPWNRRRLARALDVTADGLERLLAAGEGRVPDRLDEVRVVRAGGRVTIVDAGQEKVLASLNLDDAATFTHRLATTLSAEVRETETHG